jgi:hypothetical protein
LIIYRHLPGPECICPTVKTSRVKVIFDRHSDRHIDGYNRMHFFDVHVWTEKLEAAEECQVIRITTDADLLSN